MAYEYFTSDFRDLVNRTMTEWHVPGASMAIVENDNVQTSVYGVVRPHGAPVTDRTKFHAASMSKSFTAAAIATLVDDNEKYPQVQWDTPVSKLMPDDFLLHDSHSTESVTIADMLSHRSGIAGHEDALLSSKSKYPCSPQSQTRSLRYLPCNKPIRTSYQYSNTMFTAASYLVEHLTGQPFSKFLRDNFWSPLGMSETTLGVQECNLQDDSAANAEISPGWYWDKEQKSYIELPLFDAPNGQGAGAIISNVIDWTKWVQAVIEGKTGVSVASFAEMTKPHILVSDFRDGESLRSPDFYGLGWHIHYYAGYKVVSHAGGVPGHLSHMIAIPRKRWGFVIFGNSEGMGWACRILAWTLIDELLKIPEDLRVDWAQQAREDSGTKSDDEKDSNPDSDRNELNVKDESRGGKKQPSMSLQAYTGCYFHPAYQEFLVTLKDEHLFIDGSNRMFGYTLTFHHVEGDQFEAKKMYEPRFADLDEKFKVLFEATANGQVQRMGIDYTHEDNGEYIWFDRVEEGSVRHIVVAESIK